MPILLIFALTAACVPVKWPAPLVGGGTETAVAFTATAVGLSLLVAVTLRSWVVRTLRRQPIRKGEVANGYSRIRRVMFFVNISLVTLCVLVFGWGWFTQQTLRVERDGELILAPFAELAVPLPYFLILFGAWTIYYDAERMLHRTTVLGPSNRPFWSRVGYFFHHLRQFLLMVMLPVGLFATQQTVARFAPETTQSDWYRIATLAMIPCLILLMPLLIKPLLGLQSMPPGPIRDRLEALAKRLHFRCADFLLWPTHGAAANAMIVGLIPRVRYVIFTDRILDELPAEELEAVFGHEVGHAKHGHIWFYALFFLLSITMLAAVMLLIDQRLNAQGVKLPDWLIAANEEGWTYLPPVLVVAVYVFLVFGYLSRRCERQADVYGCRAVSCDNPNCAGHDNQTKFPEQGRGLCPTGIRACVSALERVYYINGHTGTDEEEHGRASLGSLLKGFFGWLRAWQHSTMPRRVAFLLSLIGNLERERRFQWSVCVLRWGLLLALAAALYGLGQAVTWDALLKVL